MFKGNVVNLLIAFSLGVLLTLLLTLRSTDARYIPFGLRGNKILDSRNGRVYAKTANRDVWHITVQKVGKKK